MRDSDRYVYRVYGGRLSSELPIPELEGASSSVPDGSGWQWELLREPPADAVPAGERLGEDAVEGDVRVALYAHPEGFDLAYDDTGIFELREGGREIRWRPRPGCSEEAARLDIIGRVLALALHAIGVPTLHASAVDLGGEAVAFVGPKGHGKSTLAFALSESGATLLADDTLPVRLDEPPSALPGIPRLRLWDDALRAVVHQRMTGADEPFPGKRMLESPVRMVSAGGVPLGALYLVRPADPRQAVPVRRERMDPVSSALVLVAHAKLGPLLGGGEAPRVLDRAARLCARVPLYALDVARDLDRLPDAIADLRRWHGFTSSATGTA